MRSPIPHLLNVSSLLPGDADVSGAAGDAGKKKVHLNSVKVTTGQFNKTFLKVLQMLKPVVQAGGVTEQRAAV